MRPSAALEAKANWSWASEIDSIKSRSRGEFPPKMGIDEPTQKLLDEPSAGRFSARMSANTSVCVCKCVSARSAHTDAPSADRPKQKHNFVSAILVSQTRTRDG